MAEPTSYMSPEAVEGFKRSMRSREVGSIMANAMRRMFPNWDQMTEEQKEKLMRDPKIQGKIQGRIMADDMNESEMRAKAQEEEYNRYRNKYSGWL